MNELIESKEMLKEAERTGAVKIMIPVSELKFMLQQVGKVEEMQKINVVAKESLSELYFRIGQDMDINPSAKTVYLSQIAFVNNSLKGVETK